MFYLTLHEKVDYEWVGEWKCPPIQDKGGGLRR
jgi:hypothetical protein